VTKTLAPLAAVVLAVSTVQPAGQELEPLVTDRPDATESASIVQPGLGQVEAGWGHATDRSSGSEATLNVAPATLFRIGLVKSVELRLGFGGYAFQRTQPGGGATTEQDGFADTSVGVKVGWFPEKGARPEMAVLAEFLLPTGHDDLTDSDRIDPEIRIACAHTLSGRLSLAYNAGVVWSSSDQIGGTDTLSSFLWSVSLGIGATQRLGFFVEAFGESALSARRLPGNSIDGGLTWLLQPNLQLDAHAGVGVSEDAADRFGGLGISWRFPR
jgi:hypothetical protein